MKTMKFFWGQKKTVLMLIAILFVINCYATPSDEIFNDSQVLEFHITFPMDNFFEILTNMHNNDPSQYLSATFEYNGEVYEDVGVRFKGNKSMSYPGLKKPLKIKFNEFNEDQKFHGLKKLSLSNEYLDPSFLREKITFDILNQFVPSPRANFAKVYINGQYWGLYTNVEQVDMKFIKEHFGNSEDGNLFKGDPAGDLCWYGDNAEHYHQQYELKTNQTENDWSDLIDFIHLLNFTDSEHMREEMDNSFHIYNFILFQTINNFLVNLDSYFIGGHNYFIYHRTDTNKFIHIPWDFNMSFGGGICYQTPEEIENFSITSQCGFERPLYDQMLQTPAYNEIYLMDYQYILQQGLDYNALSDRVDYLANLIRPAVYADTLKMFSNEKFDQNINDDINFADFSIPGIKSFLEGRIQSVTDQLANYEIPARKSGIFINEFMANNGSTIADEQGDFDDWIEIFNSNSFPVNLAGMFLTDDPQTSDKWMFPDAEIPAGGHLIVWADNECDEGQFHTNFKLKNSGEYIGLYDINGVIPLDEISFGAQQEDVSFGRIPDGSNNWQLLYTPTPGEENIVSVSVQNLHINEFMAENQGIVCDEHGDYDDWIELFNKNPQPINLEGLFLTDDITIPNKWRFPDVEIQPKGHILIWADNEGEQGLLHTNFKLSASGEAIYLFDNNAQRIIDQIVFGVQYPNISYGRSRDGSQNWQSFTNPTPNQPNYEPTPFSDDALNAENIFVGENYPNPFNSNTSIRLYLPQNEMVEMKIYNAKGELVKSLVKKNMISGIHNINWNGKDNFGNRIAAGVYFYKIVTNNYQVVKKMILVN